MNPGKPYPIVETYEDEGLTVYVSVCLEGHRVESWAKETSGCRQCVEMKRKARRERNEANP